MRKSYKRKEDNRRVILKHENDYVMKVGGTEWDTVKMHFTFTKDRSKARIFSIGDVFPPQATTSIGSEWTKGFAGGRIIFIDEKKQKGL